MKYYKCVSIIGLMILLVCIAGCSSSSSHSSTSSSQQQSRIVKISDQNTSWGYSFGEPSFIIRGLVTNNLGRDDSYVLVTCTIYDKNNVKLGYNNDAVGALADGESGRFEVEVPTSMVKGGFPGQFYHSCVAT